MNLGRAIFTVFGCLAASELASGQASIRTHEGKGDRTVAKVHALADLDQDGVDDYALSGMTRVGGSGGGGTSAYLDAFSGASGSLLFTIRSTAPWSGDVADAGDVNGDGVGDLLIGDPAFDDPRQPFASEGAVRLYSGLTGARLREIVGSADQEALGTKVSGLADVNGDGNADFLVEGLDLGTPFVRALSGKSGKMLYEVRDAGLFGPRRGALDRDGDGVADFLAAVHGLGSGLVRACSGTSGAVLLENACAIEYGAADFDDLDGDGQAEIVGARTLPAGPLFESAVDVCSLATGATLRETPMHDFASTVPNVALDVLADEDGDGVREIVIGAAAAAFADVVAGRTGERLYRFPGADASAFGDSVAALDDVNGDGFADLMVCDPAALDGNGNVAGAAFLFGGNDLWLDAAPKVASFGDLVTVTARGAKAGTITAIVLVDFAGAATFEVVALGPADGSEALTFADTVPPGLVGLDATFRAYSHGRIRRRLIESADETVALR